MFDDPSTVMMQKNVSCGYSYLGISFFAEKGAVCPDFEQVKRSIDFDLDYVHAPDGLLDGVKVIFTAREQDEGVVQSYGVTLPLMGISEVDTEFGEHFTLCVMRHELYHSILWRAGADPSDVARDEYLHPSRKDWADIERGPY